MSTEPHLNRRHRAPEVVLHAVQADENPVQIPRISRARPASAQSPGEFGAELAAPMADAFVGDQHTTLGEDELDIPQAQAEQVIQPYCVADDLGGKPMPAIEGRLSAHSGSFPWPTSIRQSRLT